MQYNTRLYVLKYVYYLYFLSFKDEPPPLVFSILVKVSSEDT